MSFLLERILSVISSICNKYANDETKNKSPHDLLYDATRSTNAPINSIQLGSLSLMKCISELRQHGLVHEASASGGFHTADMYQQGIFKEHNLHQIRLQSIEITSSTDCKRSGISAQRLSH